MRVVRRNMNAKLHSFLVHDDEISQVASLTVVMSVMPVCLHVVALRD
jgi:hypothetical protein